MIDRLMRGVVAVVVAVFAFAAARADVLCCPADLSGDGAVGPADLSILLGSWGGSGPGDLDGSGTVDAADLALLLNGWGACGGEWVATYGGMPGADGVVLDAIWFDDGSGAGPRLHVAGDFASIGGAPAQGVARWTGQGWEPLAPFGPTVEKLVSFDDGSGAGPSLYGVVGQALQKWTGTGWAAVGTASHPIHALAVHDDGNGPALFVGGSFVQIGGVPAKRIARFDGSSWSAVGEGVNSSVFALAVYDDGTGEKLYAGGSFTLSELLFLGGVAAWDGSAWAPLAGGWAVPCGRSRSSTTAAVLRSSSVATFSCSTVSDRRSASPDGTARGQRSPSVAMARCAPCRLSPARRGPRFGSAAHSRTRVATCRRDSLRGTARRGGC
jgi:hypothetical protein